MKEKTTLCILLCVYYAAFVFAIIIGYLTPFESFALLGIAMTWLSVLVLSKDGGAE